MQALDAGIYYCAIRYTCAYKFTARVKSTAEGILVFRPRSVCTFSLIVLLVVSGLALGSYKALTLYYSWQVCKLAVVRLQKQP